MERRIGQNKSILRDPGAASRHVAIFSGESLNQEWLSRSWCKFSPQNIALPEYRIAPTAIHDRESAWHTWIR